MRGLCLTASKSKIDRTIDWENFNSFNKMNTVSLSFDMLPK